MKVLLGPTRAQSVALFAVDRLSFTAPDGLQALAEPAECRQAYPWLDIPQREELCRRRRIHAVVAKTEPRSQPPKATLTHQYQVIEAITIATL